MFRISGMRRVRRRLGAVAAVGLLAAILFLTGGPVGDLGAQAEAPFTVTPSQASDLVDGQAIEVNVAMRSGLTATIAEAFVCRPGQSYPTLESVRPPAGNCPSVPISTSMGEATPQFLQIFAGGSQAGGTVLVGAGTASWERTPDDPSSATTLTCDSSNPCVLVVWVRATSAGTSTDYLDASTTLTFRSEEGVAGCDGGAPGAPTSAGADRMIEPWRDWTAAQCQATSGSASTQSPVPGEGDGVAAFAAGSTDLAYSAAGYDAQGFTPATRRPMVPVPVAVNAVVVAAAGGYFPTGEPGWPDGRRKPYTQIRLTAEEMAALLGQGQLEAQEAFGPGIVARNPELGRVYSTASTATAPLALSSSSALSVAMTSYLDQLGGDQWRAHPSAGGGPRGVDAALGTAEPTYAGTLNVVSDASLIDRTVYRFLQGFGPNDPGPQWVLTDLSTATRLGLTPVSIENAAGDFVAPTAESLAAGVAAMQPQDDGTLAPNVATTAAGAYPLTMVEYALAPAEPLVDAQCAARDDSQALLTSWLTFVTGDGQGLLPEGFEPLTPSLASAAASAIPRVGASASTCRPPDTVPPPTTPPSSSPVAPLPGYEGALPPASVTQLPAGGSGAADVADVASGAESGAARRPTGADRDRARQAARNADIEMPPFLGIRAVSEIVSPVAILLVVALTSGAALATSGRPLPISAPRAVMARVRRPRVRGAGPPGGGRRRLLARLPLLGRAVGRGAR